MPSTDPRLADPRLVDPRLVDPRLVDLRARVRRLEQGGRGQPRSVPLGAPALDERLPGGGLPLAGLHEITGERAEWDDGAATGFALALLSRLLAADREQADRGQKAPLLWVAPRPDLYAPGLAAFGIDPARLLMVEAGNERAVLWALEEGLRAAGSLAGVVGEVGALDRTAGRRLQLAAESAGLPCLLLRRRCLARGAATDRAPSGGGRFGPSPAVTRWCLSFLPSEPPALGGNADLGDGIGFLGRPRWRADLLHCRGAAPAEFFLEWDHATHCFAMAAPLCDRSPGAAAAGQAG